MPRKHRHCVTKRLSAFFKWGGRKDCKSVFYQQTKPIMLSGKQASIPKIAISALWTTIVIEKAYLLSKVCFELDQKIKYINKHVIKTSRPIRDGIIYTFISTHILCLTARALLSKIIAKRCNIFRNSVCQNTVRD